MSDRYKTYPASPEISKAFRTGTPESLIVLKVKPPKTGEGIDNADRFMNAVHHANFNHSRFSSSLESNRCSFEMWYQNEELEFYFVLPNKSVEDHYRRQLVGYYDGLKIEEKKISENRFLDVDMNRYIATVRLGLNRSPLEPIWSTSTGGDDDNLQDPYKPILNEVDSKTNVNFFMQVLYKPLPKEIWNVLFGKSVLDYANNFESVDNEEEDSGGSIMNIISSSDSKLQDREVRTQGASAMRERHGRPTFLTEVRLMTISDSKRTTVQELKSIVNLFQNSYMGITGQTLQPIDTISSQDMLVRSIQRDFSPDNKINFNSKKSLLKKKLKNKLFGSSTFITTDSELASLAHLPSESTVSITGVDYSKALVEGTLPPEAKSFKPVTQKEKQEYNNE